MKNFFKQYGVYIGFTVALIATLGSLYFSEIAKFPPCVLCWYQRICMYPLVAILGFSIYKRSREMILPAFILAPIGFLIGIYHNLLYYKILPESAAPCINGVSCTTKFIQWGGFVTIPLLSLLGFAFILIVLIIYWNATSNNNVEEQTNYV